MSDAHPVCSEVLLAQADTRTPWQTVGLVMFALGDQLHRQHELLRADRLAASACFIIFSASSASVIGG